MTNVKLYNADCLEEMKNIPDKSIDMILCDLPYGVLNKNNSSAKWDCIIPFDDLWASYNRIIKDNGVIVLFGQGMFTSILMQSNKKMWRYNLVWDKGLTSGFLNAKRMPLRQHEDILIFYKKQATYNPQFSQGKPLHSKGVNYKNKEPKNQNYGNFKIMDDIRNGCTDKYPTSILKFSKPHPSVSVHPTQKPVELLEYLIKTYTNENELILDNCMGSGSTAIACINVNRNFIGMEKDAKYFNVALHRITNNKNIDYCKIYIQEKVLNGNNIKVIKGDKYYEN